MTRARERSRCALVPYLTLGYPDLGTSIDLLHAIEAMGVDAVEVGIPFSDPVADGPTIQRTIEVALAGGTTLRGCLARLAPDPAPSATARVLFSYLNPLLAHGLDPLGPALRRAGCGSLLVTDLICEEADALRAFCRRDGIENCFLVSATSGEERIAAAAAASTGFVYCVSTLGVTGARKTVDSRAREVVSLVRACSDVPVAVGFGITNADDVRSVREYADGVVVGSALLQALGDSGSSVERIDRARRFLEPLLAAAHE